jgi:hypothetical protein
MATASGSGEIGHVLEFEHEEPAQGAAAMPLPCGKTCSKWRLSQRALDRPAESPGLLEGALAVLPNDSACCTNSSATRDWPATMLPPWRIPSAPELPIRRALAVGAVPARP